MNLVELIADCLEKAVLHKQLSETTRKGYGWHLRRYAAWLAAQYLTAPDAENIERFMDHLQRAKARGGVGFAPRSARNAWAALSFFDIWLVEKKLLSASAMPEYRLPKIEESEGITMPMEDADLLFNSIDKIEDPYRQALARATFMLLATGGLRPCEVCSLEVSHYDSREKTVLVLKSKRRKTRHVKLCDQCCAALDIWLTVRASDTVHKFLFCWGRVKKLSTDGLRKVIKSISLAAGFEGDAKKHLPRAARHHACSRALKNGETIDQVRIRAGHSNIKTTQIYLHTEEESMHQTRNSTSLNLDPAKKDSDFQRYLAEEEAKRSALQPANAPDKKPKPANEKPNPAKDPYLRPRSKLKRTLLK